MTPKINFQQLGQCLQRLGQGLMEGGMLIGQTGMIHRGGSIWCGGFFPGGCTTPPLNIWHPIYGGNTTNPYLLQQGEQAAYEWGAARMQQMMEELNNQQPQGTSSNAGKIGEELDKALNEEKDYSFVSDCWTELFNKADKTADEENQLAKAYKESVNAVGTSYLTYVDKKHGNDDGEMTLDEFTDYLMAEMAPDNPSDEDKASIRAIAQNIFNKVDISKDDKINKKEMSALMSYIDELADNKQNGIITRAGFGNALQNLAIEEDSRSDFKEHYDALGDE